MTVTQANERQSMCQLTQEYADDPYCLKLIQFFGWHPNARFSGLAILHALNVSSERHYIERAMMQLIDKGVVRTYSENNVRLYCLTDNESLRQAARDIARLDWSQWQVVLRQSYAHVWGNLTGRQPASWSAVSNA